MDYGTQDSKILEVIHNIFLSCVYCKFTNQSTVHSDLGCYEISTSDATFHIYLPITTTLC